MKNTKRNGKIQSFVLTSARAGADFRDEIGSSLVRPLFSWVTHHRLLCGNTRRQMGSIAVSCSHQLASLRASERNTKTRPDRERGREDCLCCAVQAGQDGTLKKETPSRHIFLCLIVRATRCHTTGELGYTIGKHTL